MDPLKQATTPKSSVKKEARPRLRVVPPDDWVYDEHGRPSWIPGIGTWATVVDRGGIRVLLPQGWERQPRHRSRLGAPPLEERESKLLLYAVWFKDCGTDTHLELARSLGFPLGGLPTDERSAIRKANRYAARGRALACSLGIWPWASWPEGKPPRGKWWEDERCTSWLRTWIAEAQGQAMLQRNRASRDSALESQLLIASALERQLLRPAEISEQFKARLLEQALLRA